MALQVLSPKNVWFFFNFNFLYIVWLNLISGFDCLVDEKKKKKNPRLQGVEIINPEQRQGDRELEFHSKKSSLLFNKDGRKRGSRIHQSY